VATGLAWTPVGGEILFIEATAFPGDGRLQITGQLGDVMRESATAALSYVKANADSWGAEDAVEWLRSHDIHVHVPAGATPKDGPSAGTAITTALISLLTGRPVRSDVAMTGEITLTGQVLPIGGLKEKALAAQRAGVKTVLAPKQNEADVDDFPPHLLKDVEFKFVSHIDQVLPVALEPEKKRARPRAKAAAG
jgi:ATP-dependent Lon protease